RDVPRDDVVFRAASVGLARPVARAGPQRCRMRQAWWAPAQPGPRFPIGVSSMSTVTTPRRPASASSPPRIVDSGDQRIVIQGVGWHVYDCLSEAIDEGQHVRLAYDGEDLEIMTTGIAHERDKEMLGHIVASVSRAKRISRKTAGETTWMRPEIGYARPI